MPSNQRAARRSHTGTGLRGLAAGLLAISLAACAAPRPVSLAQLVAGQDQLVGESLQTSGTVREIVDPDGARYYVLENASGDRVGLVPAEAVADAVGQALTVTGTLEDREGFGRVLLVESVRPAR